ncbi:hypothetical protein Xcel_0574 [Xylanimonas cellulosilytica DSM 15894]|uniref:Uncharacterized protein n=1 Tax=Xylanimonas cellulosilytica (strain DSM 15894 / JCM 12276 / CECT 5975 / KCTC 9989 / LMG 20990 / NBRC 107835 / XIL07) TaxID=446471 RepID=D1BWN1_XYLCX|nr:hypothetical protein [Xylanimonas cellulosilytica]ACZ29613.1 hypothetical protein Xcel_0574 [Xylanimonas cellulosilytica DSM 15894]
MSGHHLPWWLRPGVAHTVDGTEPTRGDGWADLGDQPAPGQAAVDTTGDDTPTDITAGELGDAWTNVADRRAVGLTTDDPAQFWATFTTFRQGVSRALDEYAARQFEDWAWPQIQQWTGAAR